MAVYGPENNEELYHIGVKRRSGRYPWGSGKEPYQSNPAMAKKAAAKKKPETFWEKRRKAQAAKQREKNKAENAKPEESAKTKETASANVDEVGAHIKDSTKQISQNPDGSFTIPKGFALNRIGGSKIDPNKAGGLYVSSEKDDAIRYMSYMGPTLIRDILGVSHQNIQYISVKKPLLMASEDQSTKIIANSFLKDKNLLENFNESIYSILSVGDGNTKITRDDLEKFLKNPKTDSAKKFAYGVSSFFGNGAMADDTKKIYKEFLDAGYDAIPDLFDRMGGTSKTAMIVINPDKLKIDSYEVLTRDMTKKAKRYVKKNGELPMSQVLIIKKER